MALVGVVPAAGHATRLQPLAGSKEMCPVGGRPVIDYLVERMTAAGCDEIRVVTRPDKRDLAEHMRASGAAVIEAHTASLGDSLREGITGLAPDDIVLFGFPDSVWHPVDGLAQVLRVLDRGFDVGLGLFHVGGDMRRFEPVVADRGGRVLSIEFKPDQPSSDSLWGCAALSAGLLGRLPDEAEPGVFFDELAQAGRVGSVRLSPGFLDIGTREALAEARMRFPPPAGEVEMTLLGSGGWMPTAARATCSALLRAGGAALLIDAGTGVARLAERPELLAGVDRLDIALTHFHLDHVVGLAYLPALPIEARPRLHGPGDWLYGRPTRAILDRLLGPPLFALDTGDLLAEVHELGPGGSAIGPWEIVARAQHRHDEPTAAIRVGADLAYCTDTAYDEGNAALATGCRLLCHEAWCTSDQPAGEATHTSARDAARVAAAAGVERLVLIHVHPAADERALLDDAIAVFRRTCVGEDGMALSPPARKAAALPAAVP
jgi:ribonuclease BN (tRNA processing enzyme)